MDTDGTPQSGIAVYAFNGTTYMNFSKTTDEYGQAVFTLPDGDYRFRADAGGTQYWSSEENDCTLPGCTATTVTTSKPVMVSVVDSFGTPQVGLSVYAFDGTTYSGYSKVTDENGAASFYLPVGDYRFRADSGGTQYWSSEENACTIPGCESVIISVTLPVTVTVVDTDGTAQEGLSVYAFDGETYSNYSKVTDENGVAVFNLPVGEYRFRADLNGTQFWSAEENSCALPGCDADSVTVTKPVTVTVAGEEGNPYVELNVYAFDGETYTGYSAVTDSGGSVIFTLPEGSYHFRADLDGVQFWSNNENSCTIPGCEEDSVILPGGTGEQEVSIDYTYDALNRLISAEYSNGTAFAYTYDAVGNVLTYAETHYGQTTVTNYTYDAANQLLTAVEDETVWQYSYDGNGSLIQTNPGTEVANGSIRYIYNTAGYLTKVENYTTEWQTQSEMTYDGLGNRLEVTTYSDGEGNTTRFVLDGGTELTAIGAESTTYYLYGLGAIGTLGESWSYILQDGAGSTRQLVDEEGAVNLSVSYTPWGDTMEVYGSGMLNLGYLGGVYDAGTGLIYMGNGQYYDPSTGRYLTLGSQPGQSNPFAPWNSDPTSMLIAPLVLIGLVFGRKKTRTILDKFLILLILLLSVGLTALMMNEIPVVKAFPTIIDPVDPYHPIQIETQDTDSTTVKKTIPLDSIYPEENVYEEVAACVYEFSRLPDKSPDPMDGIGEWGPASTNMYNVYLQMYNIDHKYSTWWWQEYGCDDGHYSLEEFYATIFVREPGDVTVLDGLDVSIWAEAMGRKAYHWATYETTTDNVLGVERENLKFGFRLDTNTDQYMAYFLMSWSSQLKNKMNEVCKIDCDPRVEFKVDNQESIDWSYTITQGMIHPEPEWTIFDPDRPFDSGNLISLGENDVGMFIDYYDKMRNPPHDHDITFYERPKTGNPWHKFVIPTYCECKFLQTGNVYYKDGCTITLDENWTGPVLRQVDFPS